MSQGGARRRIQKQARHLFGLPGADLDPAGSASLKLSYLFSSRKGWRDIVHPVVKRRGYYMLEPALVVTMRVGP